jgi:hypothetical protein
MRAVVHAYGFAIDPKGSDIRNGRRRVFSQTPWVHHGDRAIQREPDPSGRILHYGAIALDAFHASQAVRETILPDISFG